MRLQASEAPASVKRQMGPASCLEGQLPGASMDSQLRPRPAVHVRRPSACLRLAADDYVSSGDLQQQAARHRRARCELPLEGLSRQGPHALQDHDACCRRVHAPIPAARLARRFPPHPSLRTARQRCSLGQPQAGSQAPRCSCAASTVIGRRSHRRGDAALPLPAPRSTYARRRDPRRSTRAPPLPLAA